MNELLLRSVLCVPVFANRDTMLLEQLLLMLCLCDPTHGIIYLTRHTCNSNVLALCITSSFTRRPMQVLIGQSQKYAT